MGCFGKSLAGAGYVALNIIRVLNIISLLAVITASTVMLVKTFIVSKFYFFDACGHVIEAVVAGFLIITELPLFKGHLTRNWPLFGPESGFVMLGVTMLTLGNNILANLNKAATSPQNLGMAFWRIVIAAGIIVIVMGVVNLFASYIFRDTKIGLTARQVRSNGAVAKHKIEPKSATRNRRSFFLSKDKRESLPSYYSRSTARTEKSDRTRLNISAPINYDKDQFAKFSTSPKSTTTTTTMSPELRQPNLAHHPAMTAGSVI